MQQVEVAATSSGASWRRTVGAYIGLMKPHVTVLLLGTTLAAMAVAGLPSLPVVLATLLGGALAAGSANAINCYWDRDIDQLMSRTRTRALPSHKVRERAALIFGLSLGVAAFIVLSLAVNLLAALLAVAAIGFYVGIYTMWLKRTTPQNIVIGGAAGAVPVLVGWAAATGTLSLASIWMFLIIFLWTPPHFWALSLVLRKDYERAGVPMLPVVAGERETHRQIILYTILLLVASCVLVTTRAVGLLYLGGAIVLGGGFLVMAFMLAREKTLVSARRLFWFSNYYLALLFAIMVVDHFIIR
ncbi:MAG TPA: heme o synthase [Ktedonobacterales bacterium]|nr:heme o synthase [Ktedonobacterales bacterium]